MPAKKRTPLPTFHRELGQGENVAPSTISTSIEDDLRFILDRAKLWSNELGFIPAEGIRKLMEEGRSLTLRVNGDRAGYILTSGGIRQPLVIRHNTVEQDLWDSGLGRQLMKAVVSWAGWTGRDSVLCRTRKDIARQVSINHRMRGFILGEDPHVGQRGEPVEVWSIPRHPTLFSSVR